MVSSSSRSPRPVFVSCEYAAFGCESLVHPSNHTSGIIDAHYHTAAAHHISLLHARHSIVQSQKSQLSMMLEQEARCRERLQRKLDAREKKYQRLRTAFEKKRAALKRAEGLHTAADLIRQFLVDDVNIDTAVQIRSCVV